jgi:hypothetical protein
MVAKHSSGAGDGVPSPHHRVAVEGGNGGARRSRAVVAAPS